MLVLRHKNFDKSFKKLDKVIKNKFYERLQIFQEEPFAHVLHNHALKGKYEGYRSINITGDYRVVYREITEGVIEFQVIDTHSNLYS